MTSCLNLKIKNNINVVLPHYFFPSTIIKLPGRCDRNSFRNHSKSFEIIQNQLLAQSSTNSHSHTHPPNADEFVSMQTELNSNKLSNFPLKSSLLLLPFSISALFHHPYTQFRNADLHIFSPFDVCYTNRLVSLVNLFLRAEPKKNIIQ